MREEVSFDNLKNQHVSHSQLIIANKLEKREWKFVFDEGYLADEWSKLLENLLSIHQKKPRQRSR
jgi:hypothetical protein